MDKELKLGDTICDRYKLIQSDLYAVGMLAIYGVTGVSPNLLSDRDGKVNWKNYLGKDKQYDRNFLSFLDTMVSSTYSDRYRLFIAIAISFLLFQRINSLSYSISPFKRTSTFSQEINFLVTIWQE